MKYQTFSEFKQWMAHHSGADAVLFSAYARAEYCFILEYTKDAYEQPFWDFICECSLDIPNVEYFSTSRKWIQKHLPDTQAVQQYWAAHPKDFIEILAAYRQMGAFDTNITEQVMGFAKNINDDPLRFIFEIIQNADDCSYADNTVPEICITTTDSDSIEIFYNETGMLYSDIISLTTIGESNKQNRINRRLIGEKGIGFKTIFSMCSHVDVYSGPFQFSLQSDSFCPTWLETASETVHGTKLTLHLGTANSKMPSEWLQQIYLKLLDKYGFASDAEWKFVLQKAFQNCPVLFTNRLQKITLIHKDICFSITNRPEEKKVTYALDDDEFGSFSYHQMTKDVVLSYEQYASRYPDQLTKEEFSQRSDRSCFTYPIHIIAAAQLDEIKEGCLYSYLPTSTIIKAPINIQLPVKLNLDRSCIDIEQHILDSGDSSADHSCTSLSLWTQRMFKELYEMIPAFYNELKQNPDIDIFSYIPDFSEDQNFFKNTSKDTQKLNLHSRLLFEIFKQIPYFKGFKNDAYCTAEQAMMFDPWVYEVSDGFAQAYFQHVPQEDKNGKFLAEHSPLACRAECFGFHRYIPKNDKQKTKLLNAVFAENPDYQPVVRQEVLEEKKSEALPDDVNGLTIFPARRSEHTTQYCSYTDHYWIDNNNEAWAYTRQDSKICFWDSESKPCTPESIWDTVFQSNIEQDVFEDLMDLMNRMKMLDIASNPQASDWKTAVTHLLKHSLESKELPAFWKESTQEHKSRISQLIDLLDRKASQFAQGEDIR